MRLSSEPETDGDAADGPSLEELLADLAEHRRPAWRPQTDEEPGEPDGSHIGGVPWLAAGEPWPACPECGQPMALFLQLNLAKLPAPLPGGPEAGLLQLFFCTNAKSDCASNFVDTPVPTSLARIVATTGSAGLPAVAPEGVLPERRIIGWEPVEDYPSYEDLSDLGRDLSEAEFEVFNEGDLPVDDDKLLGWPTWIQSPDYPLCPECDEPMRHVFQLVSLGNLDYTFGDGGTGWLHQCPAHPHELGFGWQCF